MRARGDLRGCLFLAGTVQLIEAGLFSMTLSRAKRPRRGCDSRGEQRWHESGDVKGTGLSLATSLPRECPGHEAINEPCRWRVRGDVRMGGVLTAWWSEDSA